VYRIADSPRGPFRTPRGSSGGRFDARRWYAAKSCPKAGDPSKRVYFGWVADKLEGQWSWGGDMGIPREISAREDGLLIVEPCRDYLNTCFRLGPRSSLPWSISLSSVGETVTRSLPVDERLDYSLEFELASQDTASFGLSFRTDEDNKGYRLRFVPTAHGSFDVSLLSCPPPLDDFWADQYDLHLPREVDGPEIARHSSLAITGSVMVTVMSDVLEIFAGGKSISYRLPCPKLVDDSAQNGHVNGNWNGALHHDKDRSSVQELGVFVEDGELALANVSLCWIGPSTS
jgi:beta-fructofuranosidase